MATRSRIGIQLNDNSILSVYHHWDGYPTWLGRILKTHYNTKEKVSDLIDGGDMSSCWTDERWEPTNKKGHQHSNDHEYGPQYYSQRGEDCPPRLDQSLSDFINDNEEFGYVFTSAGWVCYDTKDWSDTFTQTLEIPEGALAA